MFRRFAAASAILLATLANSAAAAAAADADLDYDFGEVEPRLLNSVFNLSSTSFNPASLLAALLIGILFALTVGQGFLGGSGAGASGYGQQQQSYGQSSFYARSDKRIHENGELSGGLLLPE